MHFRSRARGRDDVALEARQIAALEAVAARAVPAAEAAETDGWTVRFTPGLSTKRANSVLASAHPAGADVAAKIAAVESFYAQRRQPARYQLTPVSAPSGLADTLARHGYTAGWPTSVLVAELSPTAAPPQLSPGVSVSLDPAPSDAWWGTWTAALGISPARTTAVAALFARLAVETAFVVVSMSGGEVAVALGVRDGDWLGVFNMATLTPARRRGAGRAALQALGGWGAQRGATRAYLQVERDNAAARRLYAGLGFREAYRYVYLTRTARAMASA